MPACGSIGILVGLAAEARLAAPLGCLVEIGGGGSAAGAEAAVVRLLTAGVRGLVSFGLAGGLDPALRPGTVVVPEAIIPEPAGLWTSSLSPASPPARPEQLKQFGIAHEGAAGGRDNPRDMRPGTWRGHDEHGSAGVRLSTDRTLSSALGGPTVHALLAGTKIAVSAAEKRRLRQATGADAIDLESGAVARAAGARGLPFAVLRVVCDPAERDLPAAAVAALDANGGLRVARLLGSLLQRPGQVSGLLALASDAAAARRALIARVAAIGQISTSV